MGWKSVRDHYRIDHIVHMDDGDLMVGAGYLPRMIKVTPDGRVHIAYDMRRGDLGRIAAEMKEDPETLLALMAATDTFETSIPVYTWSGADILLRHCEKVEWPNVTHDGDIMYNNRYSEDRDEVVQWARESAQACVEGYARMVDEARAQLEDRERDLARAQEIARRMAAEHPISTK